MALVAAAIFLTAGSHCAHAHESLAACVQHRVAMTVGAKDMDVTVQLTFFEEGSDHERKHLDTSADGRISAGEIETYLRELEPKLFRAVTLKIGDRRVELTPLRTAELDLLGQDGIGRGHLRLTVYYFAPTPPELAPGTELVVEDRLWPELRALGSIHVEGKDGCRLEAAPSIDPLSPPAEKGSARSFKARVLSPPSSSPAKPVAGFRPHGKPIPTPHDNL